jgi:protein-tyrosine phosphatase
MLALFLAWRDAAAMVQRILFVCLGNICRSPAAEAIVRDMASKRGIMLRLDSAGTGDWHVGSPPYGPMQNAAAKRGYKLGDLRARKVSLDDFHDFDRILCMDAANLSDMQRLKDSLPATFRPARLELFTDHAPHAGADHVPDPYYTRDFDAALDLIEACAQGLLDTMTTWTQGQAQGPSL